jgi:hypothetical protein
MTTISLEGINTPGGNEERTIAYLNVEYNSNTYNWTIFVPNYVTNLSDFLQDANTVSVIENQIQSKEDEWNALDPKTRTIEDPFMGESITIDIQKEEIVRPDIPDNYAKRRAEYPPITEQIAAMWKGPSSKDYETIQNKIRDIKNKYPIESNEFFVPLVVTPFQAKAALLQSGLLNDVEEFINNSEPLVQMAWNEALEFRRYSPSVLNIAQAMGWTDSQLDDLFINAYSIVV